MQAILNASAMQDEYVQELLVSHVKVTAPSRDFKMSVKFSEALQKSNKKSLETSLLIVSIA